jgi:flagellar hook assembly protein FlgD
MSIVVFGNRAGGRLTIRIDGVAGPFSLAVYDLEGNRIKTFAGLNGSRAGGVAVPWDASDDHGRALAAGTYVIRSMTDLDLHTRLTLL